MNVKSVLVVAGLLFCAAASAQRFRPPPFAGGVPGRAQMQAIEMQRHQARTLLYREALEEIRRTPRVVEVRECAAGEDEQSLCLPKAAGGGVPAAAAAQPTARRIALLVGNFQYRHPFPPLETPPHDVDRIAAALGRKLGFEVRVLKNATKADMVRAVAALAREVQPADSVFVYYAAHGYLMDDTNMGYWIPVDGSVKTAAQWISNSYISKLLGAIPARQLMLVSDRRHSCRPGRLDRLVAIAAIDTVIADVVFMTELDWLLFLYIASRQVRRTRDLRIGEESGTRQDHGHHHADPGDVVRTLIKDLSHTNAIARGVVLQHYPANSPSRDVAKRARYVLRMRTRKTVKESTKS